MAVIKLIEPYAVTQARKDVRDALVLAGEQAILLQLFHPGDNDSVPCPQCGDDVYHSAEAECTSCFGTTFNRGVRYAMQVWALFTDRQMSETLAQRGTYEPDRRHIQMEAFPLMHEHDMVVRVQEWDSTGSIPLMVNGYYELGVVDRRSIRTGSRFGQLSYDVVGQKAPVSLLAENAPITNFPILGQTFKESVQLNAPIGGPPSAVVMPDTQVIYFPLEPAPGGVAPEAGGVEPYTFVQSTPLTPWVITHGLGCEPSVTIIVNVEGTDVEVTADVAYLNLDTVTITFQTPQMGSARLL